MATDFRRKQAESPSCWRLSSAARAFKLRIRRLPSSAETRAPIEQPFGVVTRAFDDRPEINRQQNIVFATDYQRYWVALFTQPLLVADTSLAPGVAKGVVENRVILVKFRVTTSPQSNCSMRPPRAARKLT